MIATETFSCEYDGRTIEIRKGISYIHDDGHELVLRYPNRFRQEGSSWNRQRTRTRAVATQTARPARPAPQPRPAKTEPAWRLAPRLPADWRVDDHARRRTAKHEAAHAVMAHLLGWQVESVNLNERGGGATDVIWPKGLDPTRRAREGAVIRLASQAHIGWTANDGYRQDENEAWQYVRQITRSENEASQFLAALRAHAEARVATPEFRNLALRVEDALVERGRVGARDLRTLLAGRPLDSEPPRIATDLRRAFELRNAGASWLLGAA